MLRISLGYGLRRMNIKQTVVCLFIFLCAGLSAQGAYAEKIEIVALGDSLTAGYQLAPQDAFPVRLEAELKARGHDVSVLNAGVSGDTSTGALSRFDWAPVEVSPETPAFSTETSWPRAFNSASRRTGNAS